METLASQQEHHHNHMTVREMSSSQHMIREATGQVCFILHAWHRVMIILHIMHDRSRLVTLLMLLMGWKDAIGCMGREEPHTTVLGKIVVRIAESGQPHAPLMRTFPVEERQQCATWKICA